MSQCQVGCHSFWQQQDVRWKAAAGLGIDDEGFDASVLTLWRHRLRASEHPERIDAVREVAAECGAL